MDNIDCWMMDSRDRVDDIIWPSAFVFGIGLLIFYNLVEHLVTYKGTFSFVVH